MNNRELKWANESLPDWLWLCGRPISANLYLLTLTRTTTIPPTTLCYLPPAQNKTPTTDMSTTSTHLSAIDRATPTPEDDGASRVRTKPSEVKPTTDKTHSGQNPQRTKLPADKTPSYIFFWRRYIIKVIYFISYTINLTEIIMKNIIKSPVIFFLKKII